MENGLSVRHVKHGMRNDSITEDGVYGQCHQNGATAELKEISDFGIDLLQARVLADIICCGVSRLEAIAGVRGSGSPDYVRKHLHQGEVERQGSYYCQQGKEWGGMGTSSRNSEAKKEVLSIIAASAQLAALVRTPSQAVMELATGFNITAALRVIVEFHIPEVLRFLTELASNLPSTLGCDTKRKHGLGLEFHKEKTEDEVRDGNEGVPILWISILCGIDRDKLARILRLLATHHVFTECSPGEHFAHNRLSKALDSGASIQNIIPDFKSRLDKFKERLGPVVDLDYFLGSRGEKGKGKEKYEEDEEEKRWRAKYGMPTPGAALAALVGITCDESMMNATALSESLAEPLPPAFRSLTLRKSNTIKGIESMPSSFYSQPDFGLISEVQMDPSHPLRAAFSRARVHQGCTTHTMFDWLGEKRNGKRLVRFGCAMRAMGELGRDEVIEEEQVNEIRQEGEDIFGGFDWTSLPAGGLVVDVGGGVGAASLPLISVQTRTEGQAPKEGAYLNLVVQDVKAVITEAPSFWAHSGKESEKAVKEGRVQFEVQDFFEPQPKRMRSNQEEEKPVAFLLRMICHNWPDTQCIKILRNLREVANDGSRMAEEEQRGPSTKLVLIDNVMMLACRNSYVDESGEAPEPLLANWGSANGLSYKLDIQMLSNHNAGERTLAQFETLLARSGWQVVEVHAVGGNGRTSEDPSCWMRQIVAVPAPLSSNVERDLAIPPTAPAIGEDEGNERSPTLVNSPRDLAPERRDRVQEESSMHIDRNRRETERRLAGKRGTNTVLYKDTVQRRETEDWGSARAEKVSAENRIRPRTGTSLRKKASRILRTLARVPVVSRSGVL